MAARPDPTDPVPDPDDPDAWDDAAVDAYLDEAMKHADDLDDEPDEVGMDDAGRTDRHDDADAVLDAAMRDAEGHAARPQATPPTGRSLTAALIVLSALLPALSFGWVAVGLAAGPEILGDGAGGDVRIVVGPACGATSGDRRCFAAPNVTVLYASGGQETVAMIDRVLWHEGEMVLTEARATVRVEEGGEVWEREVWVPEGTSREVEVYRDTVTTTDVLGREPGYASLFGLASVFAILIVVSTLAWWVKGSFLAAQVTRGALTLGLMVQGGFLVAALFVGSLGFVPALVFGWTFLLRSLMSDWVRRATQAPTVAAA